MFLFRKRRQEKKIQRGKELLAKYIAMMDQAEELCDPKMAYEAFSIGCQAAKLLGCKDPTEARYYYYKQ